MTRAAQTTEQAVIYIYGDKRGTELLSAARVELHAADALPFELKAGEEQQSTIEVVNPPVDGVRTRRLIEVYSSDPHMIYGPSGIGSRNIMAINQEKTAVPICFKCISGGQSKSRVTAVDLNSRETLASYIIIFNADKPLVENAFEIECTAG